MKGKMTGVLEWRSKQCLGPCRQQRVGGQCYFRASSSSFLLHRVEQEQRRARGGLMEMAFRLQRWVFRRQGGWRGVGCSLRKRASICRPTASSRSSSLSRTPTSTSGSAKAAKRRCGWDRTPARRRHRPRPRWRRAPSCSTRMCRCRRLVRRREGGSSWTRSSHGVQVAAGRMGACSAFVTCESRGGCTVRSDCGYLCSKGTSGRKVMRTRGTE
ncbi:hypothetical protein T484DRAFT_1941335 [Baffinella frigidus]|nr:hypothetical protein T484DRAFT_1941335 [Cryptophyta sp. CCMP2293]